MTAAAPGGVQPIWSPSPNFDSRGGADVDVLVLHYTGMQSGAEAIARLCDPAARVSCHYVVEEDGRVFALVEEGQRAWHAGISFWRGRRELNFASIGIEIVNPGHEWGYRPFPAVQMASVAALCRGILARHPIPARNVVAHSDIAPDRKEDPGELFDWRGLAAQGIGLWPASLPALPGDGGIGGAVTAPGALMAVRAALARIGFEVAPTGGADAALATVLRAFQRHWRPEAVTGAADAGTLARLRALAAALAPIR